MAPVLDFDPDPAVWLVGPTEARPVERWIPLATDAMIDYFALGEEHDRQREIVHAILAATARAHPSELPYYVLRWRELADVPLPLFIGMVARDADEDMGDRWLLAAEQDVVERPVIDELPAAQGTSIRRSLPYSTDEFRQIVVGARYVVDTGHPETLVLAQTASHEARDVLLAQEDIAAFLQTVRIGEAPEAVA